MGVRMDNPPHAFTLFPIALRARSWATILAAIRIYWMAQFMPGSVESRQTSRWGMCWGGGMTTGSWMENRHRHGLRPLVVKSGWGGDLWALGKSKCWLICLGESKIQPTRDQPNNDKWSMSLCERLNKSAVHPKFEQVPQDFISSCT